MKGNKGITLIALVITIIVLLILAAVSIAMLTGENSILRRGSQASAENQLGAANDAVSLYVTNLITDFYEDAYVTGNNTTLGSGLNAYLAKMVPNEAALQKVLTDEKITNIKVDKATFGSGVTTNVTPGTIEMSTSDNTYTYKSTGTVVNGKITWVITKNSK